MNPAAVATLIGVLVAPVLGYLAAVRKLSGKISTTTADQLWEESRSIRQDYREQVAALHTKIEECDAKIRALERHSDELHQENGTLRRMVDTQQETIADLTARVKSLTDDNEKLKTENRDLRIRVEAVEQNGTA